MYNAELKTGFIRGYTQSIDVANTASAVFKMVEPYEQAWQADFCTKDSEDLQPVVDDLVASRPTRLWLSLNILRAYVRWCLAKDVPGACDGLALVTIEELNKVRRRMVESPAQLQQYLDEIFSDEREQMVDNIYRCYYWMAYGGVGSEDILTIKTSDVSLSDMCIRYKDTSVPIYREALPAFINAIELPSFLYRHPNYTKPIRRDRAEGDILIRGFRRVTPTSNIRSTLSHLSSTAIEQGRTERQLSYHRAWLSGLFFRMHEREQDGLPVDFTGVAAELGADKTYVIKGRRKIEHVYRRRGRDYMEDYQRWKMAFSL